MLHDADREHITEKQLRDAEIKSFKAAKDKELNHFKSMAAQELAAVQAMAAMAGPRPLYFWSNFGTCCWVIKPT
jgi:hypothetical protein